MINLRYHIVSITAVFLALGIGLAFGAAFIDRATVDALNRNLTEIERQNSQLEDENDRLRDDLERAEQVEQDLVDQGLDQFVSGQLTDRTVLVVAGDGVADDAIDRLGTALDAAGARRAGILRVTDRLALDDDGEVEDLQEVLGLAGAQPQQLRRAVVRRLRTLFAGAMEPLDPEATSVPDGIEPAPPLIAGLIDAGFLELAPADPTVPIVPSAGLHLVFVVGREAPAASEGLLLPLASALATPPVTAPEAPPPALVVAEPRQAPPEDDERERPAYVSLLRADEVVGPRLGTVDDLDGFAGLAAVVLAVSDAGVGRHGHYGILDDAQSLLPAPGP